MSRGKNSRRTQKNLAKTTVVSGDEHYTVALSNESKVVLAKFKA